MKVEITLAYATVEVEVSVVKVILRLQYESDFEVYAYKAPNKHYCTYLPKRLEYAC